MPGDPVLWARPGRLAEAQPAVARSVHWLRQAVRTASGSGAHVVVSLTPHRGQLGASPSGRLTAEPGGCVLRNSGRASLLASRGGPWSDAAVIP